MNSRDVRHFGVLTLLSIFSWTAIASPQQGWALGPVTTSAQILQSRGIAITKTALAEALSNPDPVVKWAAADQLTRKDLATDGILLVQAALATEKVPKAKINFAMTLAQAGDAVGFSTLEAMCHDALLDPYLRIEAARHLVEFGREGTALNVIIDTLETTKNHEPSRPWANPRVAALDLIPTLKHLPESGSDPVFDLVAENLTHENSFVRSAAAQALRVSQRTSAIPRLQDALAKENDPIARAEMLKTLTVLTKAAEKTQ